MFNVSNAEPKYLDQGIIVEDDETGGLVLVFKTAEQPAPQAYCNKTGRAIIGNPTTSVTFTQEALFRRGDNKLRLGVLPESDRAKVLAGKDAMAKHPAFVK